MSESVFNEGSIDVDFRVEGNGATHAFFVEGETDRVGLLTSDPTHTLVVKTDSGGSTNVLKIEEKDSTDAIVQLSFGGDYDEGSIHVYNGGTSKINLRGNGTSYIKGGDLEIESDGARFYVKSATNELVSIGRAGSSGTPLQQGYFRMKSSGDNKIAFHTAGDSYINGGSLGIGTDSPDQTLHVHKGSAGSIASASDSVLTLENSGTAILQFLTPNSNSNQIRFGDPQDNGAGYIDYNHNTSVLSIGVNGPEKMRIDSSGNIGIGTSSINSNAKVHIRDGDSGQTSSSNNTQLTVEDSGTAGIQILTGTTSVGGFWIGDSNGSETGGKLYYSNNDDSWQFYNGGSTNSVSINSDGEFIVRANRNGLALNIISDHSSGPYGMKIDFDSATPNSTTEYFITCQDSTNDKFIVHSNGDVDSRTNSYSGISDERLKENIVDATPKLNELNQVRVVNYNFKDDPDKKQLGVVAQELQKIFPKMINEIGEDKHLSVKYSIFVPMLIKGIQELSAKVTALEGN